MLSLCTLMHDNSFTVLRYDDNPSVSSHRSSAYHVIPWSDLNISHYNQWHPTLDEDDFVPVALTPAEIKEKFKIEAERQKQKTTSIKK